MHFPKKSFKKGTLFLAIFEISPWCICSCVASKKIEGLLQDPPNSHEDFSIFNQLDALWTSQQRNNFCRKCIQMHHFCLSSSKLVHTSYVFKYNKDYYICSVAQAKYETVWFQKRIMTFCNDKKKLKCSNIILSIQQTFTIHWYQNTADTKKKHMKNGRTMVTICECGDTFSSMMFLSFYSPLLMGLVSAR